MGASKPGQGKHSCHTWVDRWTAYTAWRKEHGLTSAAVHQAAINFVLDSGELETISVKTLVHEARIIQHNRQMKLGGEE